MSTNLYCSNVTDAHLIALDWGTTSLRAYRFGGDGEVAESRQLPAGIMRAAPDAAPIDFERVFEQACGDWISATSAVIACGMIGSAQGWCEAAYLDVPTSLDQLGRALTAVETRCGAVLHIIPGLIARGPLPDVMRGEETQVAGAVDPAAPQGADTWIGLPGTHSKWVRVRDRRIVELHTFMTGEVFAALCGHSLLGRTMRPPATPDLGAFDRGVEVARSPEARLGVLSNIFSTRTLGLVGALSAEAQADYLSGLLIGHELAALEGLGDRPGDRAGDRVDERAGEHSGERVGDRLGPLVLVGSDDLCQRYRRALASFGHAPAAIASGATERGLWRVAASAGLLSQRGPC
jgi:2-dehydro-3-deoxygalactonokinase